MSEEISKEVEQACEIVRVLLGADARAGCIAIGNVWRLVGIFPDGRVVPLAFTRNDRIAGIVELTLSR